MELKDFLKELEINYNNWNDYNYCQTAEITIPKTNKLFVVHIYPNEEDGTTYDQIKKNEKSDDRYLYCKEQEYYELIKKTLRESDWPQWYELTGDLAYNVERFIKFYDDSKKTLKEMDDKNDKNEFYEKRKRDIDMFDYSFFRNQHNKEWKGSLKQLHRLTVGRDYLSDYNFSIHNASKELFSVDVKLKDNIVVKAQGEDNVLPFSVSNNVFAIIGDNGGGKTTFIKNLAKAFLGKGGTIEIREKENPIDIKEDVNKIEKILYVSFSPFDTGIEEKEVEEEKAGQEKNARLQYIGIHGLPKESSLNESMTEKIVEYLKDLRNRGEDRKIWFQLMNRVNSERWIRKILIIMEDKFNLANGNDGNSWEYKNENNVNKEISELSSGQKILLLSLTKIILEMTERTVVFFDEPELFLHPPLIKAYIRLIADLTSKYNGLAFIVTHSPITIQEIPHQCVKVAERNEMGEYVVNDIDFKTFGESITSINESIFSVGLSQTGYYNLIESMRREETLKDNIYKLDKILGSEGKVLVKYLSNSTICEN